MRWRYRIGCACPGTLPVERYTDAPTIAAAQYAADAEAESYGRQHCGDERMAVAQAVRSDGLRRDLSRWAAAKRREALLRLTTELAADTRLLDRIADLGEVEPMPGWEDRAVERWQRWRSRAFSVPSWSRVHDGTCSYMVSRGWILASGAHKDLSMMTPTTETTTTITHHCDECGAEIDYAADGCAEHPDAAIISVPTPQCAPSVRLTEVSRQRSRCVDLTGAVDLRIMITVAGRIGERNYGAGGLARTVAITLVPTSDEPGTNRPFGDALDHWLADDYGLLAELPDAVRRVIVDELAAWMDDERRAVDVDISEVVS